MITLKGIIDEDFVNFKVPSMVLEFPRCSFKCGVENCQNRGMASMNSVDVSASDIYKRYANNPITRAVVCQGLEPMDSWDELNELLFNFRIHECCFDPIVIYTGYDKDEISEYIEHIRKMYSNVIVKFGRYMPGQQPHFDKILGVKLSSDNQYAERITR